MAFYDLSILTAQLNKLSVQNYFARAFPKAAKKITGICSTQLYVISSVAWGISAWEISTIDFKYYSFKEVSTSRWPNPAVPIKRFCASLVILSVLKVILWKGRLWEMWWGEKLRCYQWRMLLSGSLIRFCDWDCKCTIKVSHGSTCSLPAFKE